MCHPEVPEGTTPLPTHAPRKRSRSRAARCQRRSSSSAKVRSRSRPAKPRCPARTVSTSRGPSTTCRPPSTGSADARRQDVAASVCYYGFPADARTPARPIEVAPKMRGPILGLWGDQDAGVGMDNVATLDDALSAADVPHKFHIYPDLGHGFLKASLEDGNTPGHREACDSWTRTIAFFRESFARSPGWSVAGTTLYPLRG